jgi:hypothetical protein
MLVPATAEDLKSAGKITVSPNFNNANNGNSVKAVQIKVITVPSWTYRKNSYLLYSIYVYSLFLQKCEYSGMHCCIYINSAVEYL